MSMIWNIKLQIYKFNHRSFSCSQIDLYEICGLKANVILLLQHHIYVLTLVLKRQEMRKFSEGSSHLPSARQRCQKNWQDNYPNGKNSDACVGHIFFPLDWISSQIEGANHQASGSCARIKLFSNWLASYFSAQVKIATPSGFGHLPRGYLTVWLEHQGAGSRYLPRPPGRQLLLRINSSIYIYKKRWERRAEEKALLENDASTSPPSKLKSRNTTQIALSHNTYAHVSSPLREKSESGDAFCIEMLRYLSCGKVMEAENWKFEWVSSGTATLLSAFTRIRACDESFYISLTGKR